MILVLLISLSFVQESKAQDPRFSQFYAAPLHLNPAMTGVYEGDWRAVVNYREQWASVLDKDPYRTIGASFDMKFHIAGDDFVAVGVSALRDAAGIANFNQTYFNLNASYMKQLNGSRYRTGDQYLIVGIQGGGGQLGVQSRDFWFSTQFDSGSNLPNPEGLASLENLNDNYTSDIFLDFSAGVMWYALMDDNLSIYAGGAVNHINGPKIGLLDNSTESMNMRFNGHIGGEIPFTDELSMLPAVSVMFQGPSYNTTVGTNFRYSNHDWREVAIRAGIWTHLVNGSEKSLNIDALVLTAVLELERIQLGISYDINISTLKNATNFRGGYELSLIYVSPAKSRYKTKCPNF